MSGTSASAEKPLSGSQCWQAVAARDKAHDGSFVYAVRTTGIYCRPGCPARTPNPENVRYFASPADAEGAGFRPCHRCRPDALSPALLVSQACRAIETALDEGGSVDLTALATMLGQPARQLGRTFKAHTGLSLRAYAEARRLDRLRLRLAQANSVTEAIYDAGFSGPRRAYELADAGLGMTPGRFAKGGAGETIGYAMAPCSLGVLMLAATPRGLTRVALGNDADSLTADLKRDFFAAQLVPAGKDLSGPLAVFLTHLETGAALPALPLDIQATAFQARVWQALMAIPRGQTISYAGLAKAIGAPKAARAVGTACGANPLALLIPCHRAVGANGSLSGYRWGLRRKRQLLAAEASED